MPLLSCSATGMTMDVGALRVPSECLARRCCMKMLLESDGTIEEMRVTTAKMSAVDVNWRLTIRCEQRISHGLEAIEREPNVHACQDRSWAVGDGRCREFLSPLNSDMKLWIGCGSKTEEKTCG
ncbi:hypothetical protein ERJ75_001109100 [Trypanosoma vivax]|nr:hypothetical protein ERJ75_001109100 [Trypanosoma vivax]